MVKIHHIQTCNFLLGRYPVKVIKWKVYSPWAVMHQGERVFDKTTLTDLSSKRDLLIINILISTVEAVECLLQLILLIYCIKKRCFLSETGELLSCKVVISESTNYRPLY